MTPRQVAVTSGEKERTHTVLFKLELRTLGEATISQRFGTGSNTEEGVSTQ
jgi:LPS-assembly protein